MPRSNVSPIDSCLFADGFSIKKHHNQAWKEESERVKAIRGEVLSSMFGLEAKIDYAIGDLILPHKRTARSPTWLRQRHSLFQTQILTRVDLRTKIEILRSLLEDRFPRMKRRAAHLCS